VYEGSFFHASSPSFIGGVLDGSYSNRSEVESLWFSFAKGIQIGKERVKVFLFEDDMILYLKDPKNSIQKLLDTINSFSNVAGYNINLQKSVAFLHTNNEQCEKEYRKIIPFTIA
jgi:hypothetical protein